MAAHQAPLSLGFSRQEYWIRLPFPSPMHAHMLSCFSHVQLCMTPWTAAHQAPLSTGFSRQEYWSGLPFPSPGHPIPRAKLDLREPSSSVDLLERIAFANPFPQGVQSSLDKGNDYLGSSHWLACAVISYCFKQGLSTTLKFILLSDSVSS